MLNMGDSIRVRFGCTWSPAVVTGEHASPRSYLVTTENGQVYRRNRKFLRTRPGPPPVIVPDNDNPQVCAQPGQDPMPQRKPVHCTPASPAASPQAAPEVAPTAPISSRAPPQARRDPPTLIRSQRVRVPANFCKASHRDNVDSFVVL